MEAFARAQSLGMLKLCEYIASRQKSRTPVGRRSGRDIPSDSHIARWDRGANVPNPEMVVVPEGKGSGWAICPAKWSELKSRCTT